MIKTIKIIIASLAIAFILGCSSDKACQAFSKSSDSSNFNQETYVWESIYFPTNRTSGAF